MKFYRLLSGISSGFWKYSIYESKLPLILVFSFISALIELISSLALAISLLSCRSE